MERIPHIEESSSSLPFLRATSNMGRNLVYPKVDKNTVHRKSDRGKHFQAMVYLEVAL